MKQIARIAWLLLLALQMAVIEWGAFQVWGMQAIMVTFGVLSVPLSLRIWLLVKGFE